MSYISLEDAIAHAELAVEDAQHNLGYRSPEAQAARDRLYQLVTAPRPDGPLTQISEALTSGGRPMFGEAQRYVVDCRCGFYARVATLKQAQGKAKKHQRACIHVNH